MQSSRDNLRERVKSHCNRWLAVFLPAKKLQTAFKHAGKTLASAGHLAGLSTHTELRICTFRGAKEQNLRTPLHHRGLGTWTANDGSIFPSHSKAPHSGNTGPSRAAEPRERHEVWQGSCSLNLAMPFCPGLGETRLISLLMPGKTAFLEDASV